VSEHNGGSGDVGGCFVLRLAARIRNTPVASQLRLNDQPRLPVSRRSWANLAAEIRFRLTRTGGLGDMGWSSLSFAMHIFAMTGRTKRWNLPIWKFSWAFLANGSVGQGFPSLRSTGPTRGVVVRAMYFMALVLGVTLMAGCTSSSGRSELVSPSVSAPAASPAAVLGSPTPSSPGLPGAASGAATQSVDEAGTQLRADVAMIDVAYMAALAKPGDDARVKALMDWYVPGSSDAKAVRARLSEMARDHIAGRSGPAGYWVVQDVSVLSTEVGAKATLTICHYDDGVLFSTRYHAKDGTPVVINDSVLTTRYTSTWVRAASGWRADGGKTLSTVPNANRCSAQGPS
jgi:hypothetical protein